MELKLVRDTFTEKSTIGKLFINGKFFCDTLEDVDLKVELDPSVKVFGHTAIPRGRYLVELTWSPHFGKVLPLLNAVFGFLGVRIHPGNKPEDTEGCILVGRRGALPDWVANSRAIFAVLFNRIEEAEKLGEPIYITVE